jgi:hypothetical protein
MAKTRITSQDIGDGLVTAADAVTTGTPGNSAIGDVAAQGSSASIARLDHVHGREGKQVLTAVSIATQQIVAATSAYLTDSRIAVPVGKLQIRTVLRWRLHIDKTAAGVSTSAAVFVVRIGTAGAIGDATILTFTFPATQTAVVDDGDVLIEVVIRGPLSASCIAVGSLNMTHNLAATGFASVPVVSLKAVSGTFDATVANLFVGLSCTTGAATVINFQQIIAASLNL